MKTKYQILLISKDIYFAVKLDEALKKSAADKSYSLYIAQNEHNAQNDLHVRHFDAVALETHAMDFDFMQFFDIVKKIQPEAAYILIGDIFNDYSKISAAINAGAQFCIEKKKLNVEEFIKQLDISILRQKYTNGFLTESERFLKSKNDFFAVINHEIKTPMTSIMGMGELLEKTPLTNEQRDYIDIINRSSRYLLKIINNALDISKIKSGRITLETAPFDIKDVIVSAHETLSLKAAEKKIKFDYIIKSEIATLLIGDRHRIRQALINLCDNAIKYTDSGSILITVRTLEENEKSVKISFEVSDTGQGIETGRQKDLLKPFQRMENNGISFENGQGTGLIISKKLIEAMGGNLFFQSSPQKGSKFWFIINCDKCLQINTNSTADTSIHEIKPPVQAPCTSPPLNASEPLLLTGPNFPENFSVLITEDNIFNQKLIQAFLTKKGVTGIEIAANGVECCDIYMRKKIDAVIMDCHMPIMDGITAAGRIRRYEKKRSLPPVPIIALTADNLHTMKEKCLAAGMDDFLVKPINFEELLQKLMKFLPLIIRNTLNVSSDNNQKPRTEQDPAVNHCRCPERDQNEKQNQSPDGSDKTNIDINKNKNNDELFDQSFINELKKLQVTGKPDIIKQLFEIYLNETNVKIINLKKAADEKNADSLRMIAHNLKSSTANVGGKKLSALFKALETKAKNNEIDNINESIFEIEENYKQLEEILKQYLTDKERQ